MYFLVIDDLGMEQYTPWTLFFTNDPRLNVEEFSATALGFATGQTYGKYFDKYDVGIVADSENIDEDEICDKLEEQGYDCYDITAEDIVDYLGYKVDQVFYASDMAKFLD